MRKKVRSLLWARSVRRCRAMERYVVLIRGINVGGKNRVSMTPLKKHLASLGYEDVQSYIQSGNLVLSSSASRQEIATDVRSVLTNEFQVNANVWVVLAPDFEKAIANNPFPEAVSEPKSLHLFFLTDAPTAAAKKALGEALSNGERLQISDHIVYLHAPNGIGRSKLVSNFDQLAGIRSTARNWRTITQLQALL